MNRNSWCSGALEVDWSCLKLSFFRCSIQKGGAGPIEGIKRSTKMLKDTWGEQIVGNFGIGTITGLLSLAVIVIGAVIGFGLLSAVNSVYPLIVMAVIVAVFVIAINLVGTALNGIYTAALYRYAVEGEVGELFDKELIADSFRQK